jgi:GTP-binding protein HflX
LTGVRLIKKYHRQHRARRRRSGFKVIALAGYTNAGKSSLLNAFCNAGVQVEDMLFATLDPTTRRVKLPHGRKVLVTDTVGFIKKLPHHLVASFRATFEGISEADIILHVADIAHTQVQSQISVVEKTLSDQYSNSKPTLLVWNKIDLLPEEVRRDLLNDPGITAVSSKSGQGIPALLKRIEDLLNQELRLIEIELPYTHWELVHAMYELGTVASIKHGDDTARIRAYIPEVLLPLVKPYQSFAEVQ